VELVRIRARAGGGFAAWFDLWLAAAQFQKDSAVKNCEGAHAMMPKAVCVHSIQIVSRGLGASRCFALRNVDIALDRQLDSLVERTTPLSGHQQNTWVGPATFLPGPLSFPSSLSPSTQQIFSLFGWLVADGWCWFVLREEYCWLVAGD
jgi:hypothetical protein